MTQVEVYEVLGLCDRVSISASGDNIAMGDTVRDEAAKVPTNDAVPGCAFALVELKYGQIFDPWLRAEFGDHIQCA